MTSDGKEETNDGRGGLKFGADAYDSDSEYVSALPTDAEERMMLAGENVKARERFEYLDEGRASNHPSTLAATNKAKASEVSLCQRLVDRRFQLSVRNRFSPKEYFLFNSLLF